MTKALKNLIRLGVTVGVLSFLQMSCGGSSSNAPAPAAPPLTPACTEPPAQVTVKIASGAAGKGAEAFGTNPLVIPAGTDVVWMNSDTSEHTATSETGVWDTGVIAAGQSSAPVHFDTIGTFPYSSSIDGMASMSGVIQVVTAPAPCPSASPSASPSPSPSSSVIPELHWAQVTEFETCPYPDCPAADGFTVNNLGQWNIDSLTSSGSVLAGELALINTLASTITRTSGGLGESCTPITPGLGASSVEVDLTLSDGSVELIYSVDTLNRQSCTRGDARNAIALYQSIDALAKKYNPTPTPSPSPSASMMMDY